jgi:hypothetical protein
MSSQKPFVLRDGTSILYFVARGGSVDGGGDHDILCVSFPTPYGFNILSAHLMDGHPFAS